MISYPRTSVTVWINAKISVYYLIYIYYILFNLTIEVELNQSV